MSDRLSSHPPVSGEHPGLSEEETKILRESRGGSLQGQTEAAVTGIEELTKKLLNGTLGTETEIHDQTGEREGSEENPPNSMTPDRLRLTNRPPTAEVMADVAKAALQKGRKNDPQTFCVEGPEEDD